MCVCAVENTYIVLIVDLDHGRIRTCTKAFNLNHSKHLIRSCVTRLDTEMVFDGFKNSRGSTAAQHARSRRANLHEKLADGRTEIR